MAQPTALEEIVANRATITDVGIYGRRAADRYDDAELAVLAELPRLEKLSLHRQAITHLPPVRVKLRSLWLGDATKLASLAGIERLVSLEVLWLTNVPALDLEEACELLRELPELTEIHLGGAHLQQIPVGITKLPSVISIDLYECPQIDLTTALATLAAVLTLRSIRILRGPTTLPDAFAGLDRITTLRILGAAGALPPSIGAMTRLEKLDLDHCKLSSVPASLGRLAHLAELVLADNPITVLPDELCDCAALERLDLRGTLVKALPAAIGRLARLKTLDAYTKKLRTVPDSIGELVNLRDLRLPWDKLAVPESLYRLQLEQFSGPPEVSERITLRAPSTPQQDRVYLFEADRLPLDFGDPKELELLIHDHTAPLPQLAKLRRLAVLTIDTGNLADAFAQLVHAPHLHTLTIVGEHVTLPPSLGGLVQVTKLVIDAGSQTSPGQRGVLVELPRELGHLTGLVSLTLRRNQLAALPDALGDLAALETLALELDVMVALPPAIGRLQRLRALSLGPGRLLALPAELAHCTALERVGIDGARHALGNLEVLAQLPALRVLSLFRCQELALAPLVAALAGSALESLDLRGTGITELPPAIGALGQLRKLELTSTPLKRLPDELRACTELRWISLPIYDLDGDVVRQIKRHLPKGRWKKQYRSSVTWYERSD